MTRLKSQLHNLERLLSNYDCRSFRPRIYTRPSHLHQHHRLENHLHEYQGEDYFPNALEDFLAIHEAREAFISQFMQLETSAQALQLQLHNFASIMNCSLLKEDGSTSSEEENRMPKAKNKCQALVDTFAAVTEMQPQLQKMTLDLNNLVIPFIIPKGLTKWNMLVNESEAFVMRYKEMAAHIEGLAREALKVSNKSYSTLLDLLEDNNTERHLQELTERLSEMQQLKENLTQKANEIHASCLSVEEQNKDAVAILQNVISTLPKQHTDINNNPLNTTSGEQISAADNTITWDTELIQSLDLVDRSAELDLLIHSKEQLLNKTREKLEPRVESACSNLNTTEEFQQLTALAQGLRETAITSVVEGKKIESEAFSLHTHIEGLEKEWPVMCTQTLAALKQEGIVEEKVLTEVKKKVRHADRVLRPTLENAMLARDTAMQAQKTANSIAMDAKASLSKGKRSGKMSAQLKAAVNVAVQQLTEQENSAAQVAGDVQDEANVSLKGVMGSMESAKSQLEGFTHMLVELLRQIERTTDVEKYDRVLNETAARLWVLRGSVESPVLNRKFQILLGAAEAQQNQLMELEKNLQELQEERISLTDIAQNLPKICPERS